MDPKETFYQPNCFCISFDAPFNTDLLKTFNDSFLSIEQAAFLHEYYHYLNNITTFEGLRDFVLSFVDRVVSITNLLSLEGESAFPIKDNHYPSCEYLRKYLFDIKRIRAIDLVNRELSIQVSNSPSKRFRIHHLSKSRQTLSFEFEKIKIKGYRYYYKIHTEDLVFTRSFSLSIGAIDEFLSSSIDEFCFQNDLSDNKSIIGSRGFYPYQLFDEILDYYGLRDTVDTTHKIIIAYTALHSKNPACTFVRLLSRIQKNTEQFTKSPESFVQKYQKKKNYFKSLCDIQNHIFERYQEAEAQGKVFYAIALYYIRYFSLLAERAIENDFFFFIRPFLVNNIKSADGKKEFFQRYKKIRDTLPLPLVAFGKQITDSLNMKTSDVFQYGEGFNLIVAMTEIIDSLYNSQIAKNGNGIRLLNHTIGNDKPEMLKSGSKDSWQIALNQFGLLGVYLTKNQQERTLKEDQVNP